MYTVSTHIVTFFILKGINIDILTNSILNRCIRMCNKFRISQLVDNRDLEEEILTFLSHFGFLLSFTNLFNHAMFSEKGESMMSQLHVMLQEETPENIFHTKI